MYNINTTRSAKHVKKWQVLLSSWKKTDDKIGYETDEEQSYTTNMPDLESEEYVEQKRMQEGEGLKISTSDQIRTRLPISLAQLKAGKIQKNVKMKKDSYCIFQKINYSNL